MHRIGFLQKGYVAGVEIKIKRTSSFFLLEINTYTILCIKQDFAHMHTYTAVIKSHYQSYLIFKTSTFGAIDITN